MAVLCSNSSSSALTINGASISPLLDPLPAVLPLWSNLAALRTTAALDEACAFHSPLSSLQGPLHIVVLGTSTTAGCGASDEPGLLNQTYRKVCSVQASWARRLHTELEHSGIPASVDIWYKNAVTPSFYAHCTSRRVPRNTSVVLLELATNIHGTTDALENLLAAVRREAPQALIAFVVWPSAEMAKAEVAARLNSSKVGQEEQQCCPRASSVRSEAMRQIIAAAESGGADIVRVGALMAMARSRGWPQSNFYAAGGVDTVHPNAYGHMLTAWAAAKYVERHVCQAVAQRRPRTNDGLASSSAGWERCYEHANDMPMQQPPSAQWRLLDRGTVPGVPKLGLASSTRGASLVIGPLPSPPLVPGQLCERFHVCLSYALRAYKASADDVPNGRFGLVCRGCNCTSVLDKYSYGLNPFPEVDTSTQRNSNKAYRNANLSVYESTCFHALSRQHSQCAVEVRNLGLPSTGSGVASDGLVELSALTISRGEPLTVSALAHVHFKGHAYYKMKSGRQAAEVAAAWLQCLPREAAVQECRTANRTYKGYERAHVNGFCSAHRIY